MLSKKSKKNESEAVPPRLAKRRTSIKMLGGTPSLYSLRKLDIDVEMVRDCPKSDNDADLLQEGSRLLDPDTNANLLGEGQRLQQIVKRACHPLYKNRFNMPANNSAQTRNFIQISAPEFIIF